MRNLAILAGLSLCLAALPAGALGGAALRTRALQLPSDLQSGHWAAAAVRETLQNHVMDLPDGRHFRGDAVVTRDQAAIALAKLAHALMAGTWRASPSVPVPQSAFRRLGTADWQTQPVTRYALAVVLARAGDYVMNGLPRPDPQAKDLAKSVAIPDIPQLKVARTDPAYPSLLYLANNHMLWADSALLHAGRQPIRGAELSKALAEMIVGVNNRLTPLGHDESGNTIDKTSHQKQGSAPNH
ncbi:MAG TPA: hypothetical protein VKT32_02560 [Chthonomonadaceae bacterium]|nr:hypothetical protein [Chthonomonadaceae bacterium]